MNRGENRKPYSKYEEASRIIIENIFDNKYKFPCRRPPFLEKLELDGYNEELKLAFEYQGKQHYEEVAYFATSTLEQRQERDERKLRLCMENNIHVVVICYKITECNDLKHFIYNNIPNKYNKKNYELLISDDELLQKISTKYDDDIDAKIEEFCDKRGGYLIKRGTIHKSDNNKNTIMCNTGEHTFDISYPSLYSGSWCNICCNFESIKYTVEMIKRMSSYKKLTVLSDEFMDNRELTFECNICGYVFDETFRNRDTCCFKCLCLDKTHATRINTTKKLSQFAYFKNLICKADENDITNGIHTWICQFGHEFKNNITKIRNHQQPCAECNQIEKIEKINKKIREKGINITCISNKYNKDAILTWKCDNDHIYDKTYYKILIYYNKYNSSCNICRKNNDDTRITIAKINNLLLGTSVICISNNYVGYREKMRWRCIDNHEFDLSWSNMKRRMDRNHNLCLECV